MRSPKNQYRVVVRLVLRFVATTALGVCVRAQHAAGSGVDQQRGDDGPAVALEREVERMSASRASGDALWPGFDPLAVPRAVYDGQRTFLFRHLPAFRPMETDALRQALASERAIDAACCERKALAFRGERMRAWTRRSPRTIAALAPGLTAKFTGRRFRDAVQRSPCDRDHECAAASCGARETRLYMWPMGRMWRLTAVRQRQAPPGVERPRRRPTTSWARPRLVTRSVGACPLRAHSQTWLRRDALSIRS